MSRELEVLEQKTVEVGDKEYLIQAFPAKYGLTVMEEMMSGDGNFSTTRMVDIICRSVTYRNKLFTEQTFGVHFSRKYKEIVELFNEVLVFNFGEESDIPLDSESSERSDTSGE